MSDVFKEEVVDSYKEHSQHTDNSVKDCSLCFESTEEFSNCCDAPILLGRCSDCKENI